MKLSVIIPAYNEEDTISQLVERVAAVPVQKEIIVVNDASTDQTHSALNLPHLPELRVITHPVNRGKGAAIRTGLAAATGNVVVIQDADLEYDPMDYPRLIAPISRGETQVVYGVRDLSSQQPLMRWGNTLLTWFTNILYGVNLKDMETCYKVMTLSVIRGFTIECNRFDIEPEITAKILRRGYKIYEVPISYRPRANKKLSPWRDGWPAIKALIKYRFWD